MLPIATDAVWQAMRARRELGGFVLVGGTALALRIAHRKSEDLDLVWPDVRLPIERIRIALRELERSGLPYRHHDNPAALSEFLDTGLELRDYQQDYLVGEVKVSFFVADSRSLKLLSPDRAELPRVAELPEIFATKCLVTAQRSRSRDWFDLYVLMRDHGFTLEDYVRVFDTAGDPIDGEIGLGRMCSGRLDLADEGFEPLAAGAPTAAELSAFFTQKRDEFEVARAAQAFRQGR